MSFIPPFCPQSGCKYHHSQADKAWYFRRGFLRTRRSGSVQRFSCKACKAHFCQSTFSIDFRVHRRLDYRRIFAFINSASGILDIAREFKVTDKVIINRLQRLSRQAIGMHMILLEGHQLSEDIAVDGFESFVYSQYFPNNYTIAVGADSQFLYSCDYAQLRRKGRMTAFQKRKNEGIRRRYPIAPQQIKRSFRDCIDAISLRLHPSDSRKRWALRTDMKHEYQNVLAETSGWHSLIQGGWVTHQVTSSRAARTTSNPLMSVNYFDREIRKDQANHVRQTVQWSKSVNNSMDRMMIYTAYHNYWKRYRIKSHENRLHAEVAGIDRRTIENHKRRFFTQRYFISQQIPDISMWKTWYRLWKTPVYELRCECPAFAG